MSAGPAKPALCPSISCGGRLRGSLWTRRCAVGAFEELHADRVVGSLAMFDRMIFKGYLTRLYPRENVR